MVKNFDYADGVLMVGSGSQVYFEVGLDGRVRLNRSWDRIEYDMAWWDASKFLKDFLARREVVEVDDYEVKRFSVTPGVEYRLSVFYEDCAVYLGYVRGRYEGVLLEHDDFIMFFGRDEFLFKVLNADRDCEVVGEGLSLDELVSDFSDGGIDINVSCSFELVGDEIGIYSNGRKLFVVGFDGVELVSSDFIYHYAVDVENEDSLIMFLWRLLERYRDRVEYRQGWERHTFKSDNFVLQFYDDSMEFEYFYEGSGFEFSIRMYSVSGEVSVVGRLKNGAVFKCRFDASVGFFKELLRDWKAMIKESSLGGFKKIKKSRGQLWR